MRKLTLFFSLTLVSVIQVAAFECKPPEIKFNNNSGNMFSVEQETFLGEAIVAQIRDEFAIVEDEQINAPLGRIAKRLISHLPPSGFEYKFHVVDMPDTNAFITAGGNVFVTKKLIAFVESEDELAGILAHELGHGVVRHTAIDISKGFREILNVTSVGDREDVFSKYNEWIDNRARKRVDSGGHEGKQQIEADEIGLYAMTAAGYEPKAFTSAYDRLVEAKGNTGSGFGDFFGRTTLAQKRLREMVKALKAFPKECLSQESTVNQASFEQWQTAVLLHKPSTQQFSSGFVTRSTELSPSLREDILQLEFSPDGKMIMARDESTVFVVQKKPYKTLFRVDLESVEVAQFTSDSKNLLILTRDLRYERWNIADGKPAVVREIYIRGGCLKKGLSPKGDILACVQSSGPLRLYNLATKKIFFEKENFFKLGSRTFNYGNRSGRVVRNTEIEFTPSGRFVAITRRANTISIKASGALVSSFKDSFFLYDFNTNQEIEPTRKLKEVIALPFAFLSDDQLVGQKEKDTSKSGVFHFPSGKQVQRIEMKANSVSAARKGEYVLIRPIKSAPVGVYDLKTEKFLVANRKSALAVFEDSFVSEDKDGVLGLYRLSKDETIGEMNLPDSRLGSRVNINVSPDLNWIAVSDRSRGAIWSLYSGKRYSYTSGFNGSYFHKSGKVFLDVIKTKNVERQIGVFDINTKQLTGNNQINLGTYRLVDNYIIRSQFEKKSNRGRGRTSSIPLRALSGGFVGNLSLGKGTLEVLDVVTNTTLWTRKFEKNLPLATSAPFSELIALRWPLQSDEVKGLISDNKELRKEAGKHREGRYDSFVQVVDANDGSVKGALYIETGRGSFGVRTVRAMKDWVIVRDTQNRVLLYSLASGKLIHRFFGSRITMPSNGEIGAVQNGRSAVTIYDLKTGKSIERFQFGKQIAHLQFDKYGRKLLVLTSDQEATIMDVSKFGKTQPTLARNSVTSKAKN